MDLNNLQNPAVCHLNPFEKQKCSEYKMGAPKS